MSGKNIKEMDMMSVRMSKEITVYVHPEIKKGEKGEDSLAITFNIFTYISQITDLFGLHSFLFLKI
jgi:hypothetical protein